MIPHHRRCFFPSYPRQPSSLDTAMGILSLPNFNKNFLCRVLCECFYLLRMTRLSLHATTLLKLEFEIEAIYAVFHFLPYLVILVELTNLSSQQVLTRLLSSICQQLYVHLWTINHSVVIFQTELIIIHKNFRSQY